MQACLFKNTTALTEHDTIVADGRPLRRNSYLVLLESILAPRDMHGKVYTGAQT